MLCNLLRQQTRLVLFPRVFFSPTRQCQRHTVATIQRAFFLSHAALQGDRPAVDKSDTSEGTGESSLDARERLSKPYIAELESSNNKNCSTLWLANLHFRANAEDVCELFRSYGTVKGVHFPRDARGLKSGRAYVEFSTPEEANRVFASSEEEPFVLKERLVRLEFAKSPPRAWIPDHDNIKPNNTIYIANYPHPGDEASLLALLHKFVTQISKIHFMKDADGQATRKAFITFRKVEDAHNVILKFQGHEMGGYTMLSPLQSCSS